MKQRAVMGYSDQFFSAIGIAVNDKKSLKEASQRCGIPTARLSYYNEQNIVPSGDDFKRIRENFSISEFELVLKMGRLDHSVIEKLQLRASEICGLFDQEDEDIKRILPKPVLTTDFGELYQGDCIEVLKALPDDSVDMVFADPPFNLSKLYPSKMNDNLKEEEYLKWTEMWVKECTRVLKPGGAFLTWNLPIWNIEIASFLRTRLTFRHWISVDVKYSLPIKNKLYPSHYSLLYFVKGPKPKYFNADRLATDTCPKCYDNLKDYGGYKHKMNPLGISLTDVWSDISPVRHAKYKKREGANELPVKLLDRVIQMASEEGDVILDPFGGSGTTYAVAELKKRRWIGVELGPCEDIVNRFDNLHADEENLSKVRCDVNNLYPPKITKERLKRGLWVAETYMDK